MGGAPLKRVRVSGRDVLTSVRANGDGAGQRPFRNVDALVLFSISLLDTQYRFAEASELYKRAVGGFVAVSRPSHPIAITYQNH
jgi:hypothetical protein